MGCMQADCGTLVHLDNGVVTNIEGNPDCPTNRGKVCIRGISAIMGLYNPYRIKAPLKRTNPNKGLHEDPGWIEISWDEALNMVAERLRKIREEDPRRLVVWEGWGCSDSLFITPKEVEKSTNYTRPGIIFADAFGTPNQVGSHGPLCSIHFAANLVHGQHPEYISDLEHCRYLIAPGRTVGPNIAIPGATDRFLDTIERGLKLVTLDPRCSAEGSKAHRWIPIRPGTELAFALAMIHCILYEIKHVDEWFLKNRTNGPYLIGPDGYYLRDPESGKPLVWDRLDNRAKTFDDNGIRDYALEGQYGVNNVEARPSFDLIKDRMHPYTPEWAQEITTVPADTLRTVSREFVEHAQIGSSITIDGFEFPHRPAQFGGSGRGTCSHQGGMYFDLAGKIINMLVGAVEVPGGITGNRNPGPGPWTLEPNEDGVVKPILEAIGTPFKFPPDHADMGEFYPHKHTAPYMVARAIVDPERYHLSYPIEMFLLGGANSLRGTSDQSLFVEAFRKVPFVATITTSFDETTQMADVILPESFFLERRMARFYLVVHQSIADDVRGLELVMGRQGVTPLHNTKSGDEILLDLAERAGFLTGRGGLNDVINHAFMLENDRKLNLNQRYSLDEIIDTRIKQIFGDGHSFEEVLSHGLIYRFSAQGKTGYNYYYWPENRTRHPIYFERIKRAGDSLRQNMAKQNIRVPGWEDQEDRFFAYYEPIPHWIPSAEYEGPTEYDLRVVNWKTPYMPFGAGNTQENAWLWELRDNDPYEMFIQLNPEAAHRRNLKDGDCVCVESRYGTTKGRLKITNLIHPEVVGIPACYGRGTALMDPRAKEGSAYNDLITSTESIGIDPLSGSIENSPRVKVYRAEEEQP
jgi:anaerobic selenocysteine-containing dehydrogenase